jgi:hypothetical protein
MTFEIHAKYYNGPARIAPGHYGGNGRIAWRIVSPADEPLFTATVNLDHADSRLDAGTHVLIKDWSENEGVLSSLVEAKIVRDTGERVPTGYVEAALCEVLVCF